ncbi:MAG: FUSC family protein [Hyphomicrobiales bacterium]|nr:FUSC family protein [Hyphomicrobiales bacterium]
MANAVRAVGPPLLFGVRLWGAVCLALYVAFWLQLDNPFWAGITPALVSQPQLGASLRRGWFMMIGTIVGSVAIVALTACFPQDRAGFLVGLSSWGAACALATTVFRNALGFGAALAGITAAIIAGDNLGATGGPNDQVFMLAVTRCSEVCIGIVSAGVILAGTDLGGAQRRLATVFAVLAAEITKRFADTLALAGPDFPDTQPVRVELVRRVFALDPVLDETFGESSQLRAHKSVLLASVAGLFEAVAGWRIVAVCLAQFPDDQGRQEADAVLQTLPGELRSAPGQGGPTNWISDPVGLRRISEEAVQRLIALPAQTPSLRLLADQTSKVLAGIIRALDGLALLVDNPSRPVPHGGGIRLGVPDWLPALVGAARAFVTIGAFALFWIITAWPDGAFAIQFAAIGVILFAPRADQAHAAAMSFVVGTALAAAIAAIIKLAVLPGLETFVGFAFVSGLVLVPAGALMAQPSYRAMFTAVAAYFSLFVAPTNLMTYDTVQFYNGTLARFAGLVGAALSFLLLPPLAPALRTRRLLALTLRDLRRLATSVIRRRRDDWESRIYSRFSALPDTVEPLQRAQLLAALSVGGAIIQLCSFADRLNISTELDEPLRAIAGGNGAVAIARLGALDDALAARPDSVALGARACILAISQVLTLHAAYFDAGAE